MVNAWDLAKLNHAKRLLKQGFSAQQVGRKLVLSQALINELDYDRANETAEQVESFADFRKRESEEVERLVVKIAKKNLASLSEHELLGPESVGVAKDCSAMAYLWLRKDDTTNKAVTHVNLNILANAKQIPTLGAGTGSVVEIESTPCPDAINADRNESGD